MSPEQQHHHQQQHHHHHTVDKVRRFLRIDRMPRLARKIFVGLIGGTILLVGVVMLIAPGPAIIVIPVGLLVLGSEFLWAQKASEKIAHWFRKARAKWRRNHPKQAAK